MSRLKSPLTGNKNLNNSNSTFRTLDVPNEEYMNTSEMTEEQQEMMRQTFESRGMKFNPNLGNQAPSPPPARQVIDQSKFQQHVPVNDLRQFNDSNEYFEKRKSVVENTSKLSDGARRRIELLLETTRNTKVVVLNDVSFELQTLTSKEARDIIKELSVFDGSMELGFEVRRQNLARSLVKISEYDVSDFLGTNDLGAVLEFLDELDEQLFTALYEQYTLLVKETGDKYSVKNVEQFKEVVEEIKK